MPKIPAKDFFKNQSFMGKVSALVDRLYQMMGEEGKEKGFDGETWKKALSVMDSRGAKNKKNLPCV